MADLSERQEADNFMEKSLSSGSPQKLWTHSKEPNKWAIGSLILAILSIIPALNVWLGLPAICCGVASFYIKKERGKWRATSGIVIGGLMIIVGITLNYDLRLKPVRTVETNADFAFAGDGTTVLVNKGEIRDFNTWELKQKIEYDDRAYITSEVFSSDSKMVAASGRFHVKALDIGENLTKYYNQFTPYWQLQTARQKDLDNVQVYGVRIWDSQSGAIKMTLTDGCINASSVEFSADNKIVASVCSGNIFIWNLQSRERLKIGQDCLGGFDSHCSEAESLSISADGRMIAIGGYIDDPFSGGRVTLWDLQTRGPKAILTELSQNATSVSFSPDSKTLAAASNTKTRDGESNNTVYLWDVPAGTLKSKLSLGNKGSVFSLAFSPDGKMLAAYGIIKVKHTNEYTERTEATLHLWNLQTGKLIYILDSVGGGAPTPGKALGKIISFSADGRWITFSGNKSHINVWNLKTVGYKRLLDLLKWWAKGN